jgi:hypothetical protein
MTKISVLGIAAVAAATAFAVPAFAQHRMGYPADVYAAEHSCANYDPGNPHNKVTDFLAWSAWRARGGWDDRTDINCVPVPGRTSAY